MILLSFWSCTATLDEFVFNGLPCDQVNEDTCTTDDVWGRMCTSCAVPYDWREEHPWFPSTLADGQTIRPIERAQQAVLVTGEARLDVWFLPSHREDPVLADVTVLYNHGNFGGIEHYRPRVRALHELGYNVLIWDYRGYGKTIPNTPPSPSEFLGDALAVREFAADLIPEPRQLVVYGYSLGAIPAVEMATQTDVCALILEAPFPSLRAIADQASTISVPETYLSEGRYDNRAKLEGYPGPVQIMVGSEDGRFGPTVVRPLLDGVTGPTDYWELPGVEHGISNGGVVEAGLDAYGTRMRTFLADHAPECL